MYAFAAILLSAQLQSANAQTDYSKFSPSAMEAELKRLARVETKVLVPMRDGVGLSTDVYRPKLSDAPAPTVFIRTPYNMNTLSGLSLRQVLEGVERGYAVVLQNERGRYFSEGDFEILGRPRTDGYDALSWIASQPWSNGKVGTLGCSSTAEWQLQLAAANHPAHAAMVPMASGAGIGRVGDFLEQGNWYRGGVPRILFSIWLYGVDNPLRPEIPRGLDAETRQRVSTYNDLDADKPDVNWSRHVSHLPYSDLLTSLGEPRGLNEDLIARLPNDPAWFEGGLYHDAEGWGVPALWFNSWYDVSIGPNMALFNHARAAGLDEETRDNQFAVIAPNNHCQFFNLGPDFVSGDRALGDASFDVTGNIWTFFDRFLKGRPEAFPASVARVRYFSMGDNVWKSAEAWPPKQAKEMRLYLRSRGDANSIFGDGRLSFDPPRAGEPKDDFVYDPMNPVPTVGGGDCCNGGLVKAGAFDQRSVEARNDVLVYTTDPLEKPVEIAGFVDAVLHVSSDAKDTDFSVKLVDVGPEGDAIILDDTIMRARFRDGYDREVFMSPDEVYKLDFTPMTTANVFAAGHRIRVEISSSNFPKFVRNLNTGGRNEFESKGVAARNSVHHSKGRASYISLPVIESSVVMERDPTDVRR
jgi:hypothetical protein